ncbi:MAG: hypothetical protein QXW98_05155 [Candidatus Caldarchaeum sp.]
MFFSEVLKNLRYTKLEIRENNNFPTARAMIKEKRMIIEINTEVAKDDRMVKQLFLHEVAHFVRDDLNEMKDVNSNIDRKLMNIAMDCVINSQLMEKLWYQEGYVTHKGLCEKYNTDKVPHPSQGWEAIYQFLKSLPENQQEELVACFVEDMEDDGSISEEDRIIISSEIENAIKKASGEFNPSGKQAGRNYSGRNPLPDTPSLEQNPILSAVRKALRYAQQNDRSNRVTYKNYHRSYMREGRIEGLKGVVRKPLPNIGLFLDVSGSMSQEYEKISDLIKKIAKDCDFFLWGCSLSSKNSKCGDVGGGTDPSVIVSVIGKYSSVIIVTDGYFGMDEKKAVETAARKHSTKLVWVITSDEKFGSDYPVIRVQ